tara:strand:- start:1995 stop:2555 length:561 start_codon:yes stop_codon:yes gene_type:complete
MATDQQKLDAYAKYQAAETEGTKINFPSGGLVTSDDFVTFCQNFTEKSPFAVDISHLGPIAYPEEIFYRVAMAITFHTYYASDTPQPLGAGNYQIVDYHRDGSKYTIKIHGVNVRDWCIQFNNPTLELSGNSMTLTEGLVKVVLTTHIDEAEDNCVYTPEGRQVLNFRVYVYGNLYTSYYLVPFKF